MEVTLEPVEVLAIQAESGASGAPAAFEQLHQVLPRARERTFYGTYLEGVYHACATLLPGDEPKSLGLTPMQIPGGLYLRDKLMNWREQPDQIAPAFARMESGHLVDHLRPSVEQYKSDQELVLLLPVRKPLL